MCTSRAQSTARESESKYCLNIGIQSTHPFRIEIRLRRYVWTGALVRHLALGETDAEGPSDVKSIRD